MGLVLLSYCTLGLHDDRQDHRAAAGGIEDEAPEGVTDGRLDGGPFSDMVVLALLKCVENAFSGAFHKLFRLADVDEAARYEVRPRNHAPGGAVDRHDDDDHAFTRELLAVSQDDVSDIADAETVDEHDAGLHLAVEFCRVARELKDAAVFVEENVFGGHAEALRELGMADEHAVFAVHRHEIARADQIVHEFQCVLARMA